MGAVGESGAWIASVGGASLAMTERFGELEKINSSLASCRSTARRDPAFRAAGDKTGREASRTN